MPRRLLLEGAEGAKVALSVDDLFHGSSAEGEDQLVLQVCDAHIEAESLHVGSSEVGAEAGPLEAALEVVLLSGVAETGKPDVEPARAEPVEEAADRLRTSHRHNRDALGVEISTAAPSQRFERDLVAGPFDEDDPTRCNCCGLHIRILTVRIGDHPNGGRVSGGSGRYRTRQDDCGVRRSAVTAAEFERLTADEVECLLLYRLRLFLRAGAAPCGALLLASQIEVAEDAAVQLLEKGLSADLTLRLLY